MQGKKFHIHEQLRELKRRQQIPTYLHHFWTGRGNGGVGWSPQSLAVMKAGSSNHVQRCKLKSTMSIIRSHLTLLLSVPKLDWQIIGSQEEENVAQGGTDILI
jgi:hypothetical protein